MPVKCILFLTVGVLSIEYVQLIGGGDIKYYVKEERNTIWNLRKPISIYNDS